MPKGIFKRSPCSKETKRKISEANKGRPTWNKGIPCTEEHKKKISKANKGKPSGWLGKHPSEESREKMSESHKGLKHLNKTKQKMSKTHMGHFTSEETKKKISKANLGGHWNLSDEIKKKMSKAHIGLIFTEKHKQNMSKARKGIMFSEEHKRKISEGQKGRSAWNKGISPSKEIKEKISKSLMGRFKGENNSNWKGGYYAPYTVDWTETLRISIRERDKYTCQICGGKQGDRAFSIHHIDYDKKNCNPDNLVTVCVYCHNKTTNGDRGYWIKYFKNKGSD